MPPKTILAATASSVKYKIASGIPAKGDFPLTAEPMKMQYQGFMDKLVDLEVAIKNDTLVIGILGDIDGDGEIIVDDAILILQMHVGLIP